MERGRSDGKAAGRSRLKSGPRQDGVRATLTVVDALEGFVCDVGKNRVERVNVSFEAGPTLGLIEKSSRRFSEQDGRALAEEVLLPQALELVN